MALPGQRGGTPGASGYVHHPHGRRPHCVGARCVVAFRGQVAADKEQFHGCLLAGPPHEGGSAGQTLSAGTSADAADE